MAAPVLDPAVHPPSAAQAPPYGEGPWCGAAASGGYTVLELIVVVFMVGLFLFFAIPRMTPAIPSEGFRNAINWFTLNVPRLKRLALSQQRAIVLEVDPVQGTLRVLDTQTGAATAAPPVPPAFTLPASVRIADIAATDRSLPVTGPVALRFSPEGFCDDARITLSDTDGRMAVIDIEPFLYAVTVSDTTK